MFGFGLLLALAILLAKGPPVDREDGGRVAFTEADLAHVHAAFERTWSRRPTGIELRKAFDRYVRDEVLYREALARGLDRNDPVVKMSLVRKITMLGTAAAEAVEPTDAELKAYFELRTERYRIPASFNLMQVCLSPEKHGEHIGTVAAELLAGLREKEPRPEELVELGDMLMLPNVAKDMSEDQLARTFGTEFQSAVMALPVGQWEGPVESGFGLHLVKITHREESRIPEWTEVRDRIAYDMQFEGRKAAEDQFYAEVLPRYQVVYSEGVGAFLEGDDGRGDAAP
ncbi:MAG: peptidyl-prolyl cis-trans isomerase [Phycisphaerales bacterium]|nr:MAG: peptidyl-prolyl cis-trans isomerase [Phycisphaerales bacterium]